MRRDYFYLGGILLTIGIGVAIFYAFYLRPEEAAGEMFREAKIIQEREDHESVNKAVDIYTRLIAKYPDSKYIPGSYYFIGACYEKIGLYRLAYLKYSYLFKNFKEKKITLEEDMQRELEARIAGLRVKQFFSEEGIQQLYEILNKTIDKDFRSRVYSEIGYSYLKVGKVKEADDAFSSALRENGDNEEAILGKARSLRRMGKSLESLSMYEQFLKEHGEWSQYSRDVNRAYQAQAYNAGISNYHQGNLYQAIKFFNIVLQKYPGHKVSENALFWIGECYYELKSYDAALTYFGKVLQNGFYHKDEEARIKRGYIYFFLKKYDLAAKEFQVYLQNYPYGKYAGIAEKWKDTSSAEITNEIEKQAPPEEDEIDNSGEDDSSYTPPDKEDGEKISSLKTKSSKGEETDTAPDPKEMGGASAKKTEKDGIDDVTEL